MTRDGCVARLRFPVRTHAHLSSRFSLSRHTSTVLVVVTSSTVGCTIWSPPRVLQNERPDTRETALSAFRQQTPLLFRGLYVSRPPSPERYQQVPYTLVNACPISYCRPPTVDGRPLKPLSHEAARVALFLRTQSSQLANQPTSP